MHCMLGKQFGIKFWMSVNQLFGSLDFVWELAIVAYFGGKYQFGSLVNSCYYCFYLLGFGFAFGILHSFF